MAVDQLPNDVEALKALLRDAQKEIAWRDKKLIHCITYYMPTKKKNG